MPCPGLGNAGDRASGAARLKPFKAGIAGVCHKRGVDRDVRTGVTAGKGQNDIGTERTALAM